MPPLLYDCHLHTEYSGDSQLRLSWVLEHAAELGLGGVCPTEHYDPAPTDARFVGTDLEGVSSRHEDLLRRGLPVLLGMGLEVTFRPDALAAIRSLGSRGRFDLIIGAVHDIDALYVREWLAEEERRALPLRHRVAPFIALTAQMVESGIFTVVGHLDYVKKYVPGLTGAALLHAFRDEMAHILQTVVETGAVLELNVAGLRHECRETYPCVETLRLYRDLGGEAVTLGSDAHAPTHFGTLLRQGAELVEAEGLHAVDWRSLPGPRSRALTARPSEQK